MTKQDKAEFLMYCRMVTIAQLRNIIAIETLARRRAYAQIAKDVLTERT